MVSSVLQDVMLGEELLTAMRLLKVGLREVGYLDGASDFFHFPILLLASGFERLMKVVICCHYHSEHDDYPSRDVFPRGRRGHDLVCLLEDVTNRCFSNEYLTRIPAARADIAFLREDEKLRALVEILSDFGQSARYYSLNVVLGEENPGPSPETEWQRLEMEILREDPTWQDRILDPAQLPSVHERIGRELVIRCERLARSLCRLFTIGGLGPVARQISPYTHHFLFLTNDSLGQSDYASVVL